MRLIASSENIDARSHAERKVAGILRDIRSDDGVAFQSVPLPRHRKKVMGEVDFVVLWKGAVVVLEVKGGQIGQAGDGVWYSTDRGGHDHPMRRSPWDQAGDATFALLEILTRLSDDAGWPFAFAVVTPDQTLTAHPEWAPQQHIGSERMTPAGLERALDELSRVATPFPEDPDFPRRLDVGPLENLSAVLTHLRRAVDAMRTGPKTESSRP